MSELGCDSIVNLEVIVNETYIIDLDEQICTGEEFIVGDSTYSETGSYSNLLQSISGCDSTVNLNLTVNPIYNDSLEACICFGDSYDVGSFSYTTSGTYITNMISVSGCDSTLTLDLTVSPNPILQGVPQDITVDCANIPLPTIVTASDGCTNNINVDFNEITSAIRASRTLKTKDMDKDKYPYIHYLLS